MSAWNRQFSSQQQTCIQGGEHCVDHSPGCLTCKQRRLKCDEGRPTCQRCAVSGRSCGGYSPPAFVIAEQPSHENFDTPLDGEVLRYFMQEGTTLVSSYANGLKRFSSLVAARLDQDYPAVKYALLSLAARTKSAHLRWDSRATRNDAISLRSSSLAHYNAAIRNLTPSKNKQHAPPEVYVSPSPFYLFRKTDEMTGT